MVEAGLADEALIQKLKAMCKSTREYKADSELSFRGAKGDKNGGNPLGLLEPESKGPKGR